MSNEITVRSQIAELKTENNTAKAGIHEIEEKGGL
jgi:hypothetical protein